MKCYYNLDGKTWHKGRIRTLQGVDVLVTHEDNDPRYSFQFRDPEILFTDSDMTISGYNRVTAKDDDTHLYELVVVTVSPGWVKPK